ncbi:MAG: molybdopterin-synthase adenylyltransferase MoeB [Dehalococcoidia bacterium]|nr:molybdopterin-synthase adenylyltransferase MoeB [Dehalococcoidia bacterium]
MVSLNRDQVKRYNRQIILHQIGVEGQKKLLAAKVLMVGAGALGSPAALYLAAAGVGTLGIVDSDKVEVSNLHRQLLHHTHDIGRDKVKSATDGIADINPGIHVIQHCVRLNAQNVMDLVSGYDIVVDGSDNFPTKYLVNDACVLSGKPNIQGGILHFLGRVTVFMPGKGCYRCIYPNPPPAGLVPTCDEVGVLGVVPGVIGLIQATEVIKLILGVGDTLSGRMLYYDALSLKFKEAKLQRNPACALCGDHPTITQPIEYELVCPLRPGEAACAVPATSPDRQVPSTKS